MTTAKKTEPKGATLFQINDDMRALEDLLESIEEGATDDDLAVVAGWLEEGEAAFTAKLENWIVYMRTQEALAAGLDEEAKRLRARSKVHANRIDRLKAALQYVFDQRSMTKVETARGTVSLVGNGGVTPVEVLARPELFPARFQKQTVTLDLDAVRKALEAGETIEVEIDGKTLPGAVLGARGKGVRIR